MGYQGSVVGGKYLHKLFINTVLNEITLIFIRSSLSYTRVSEKEWQKVTSKQQVVDVDDGTPEKR